jgi:hypothetical protein
MTIRQSMSRIRRFAYLRADYIGGFLIFAAAFAILFLFLRLPFLDLLAKRSRIRTDISKGVVESLLAAALAKLFSRTLAARMRQGLRMVA